MKPKLMHISQNSGNLGRLFPRRTSGNIARIRAGGVRRPSGNPQVDSQGDGIT